MCFAFAREARRESGDRGAFLHREQLEQLCHGLGLVRDDRPVDIVAERPHALRRSALSRSLDMCRALAGRLPLDLCAGDRGLHARVEASAVGIEVGLAVRRDELKVAILGGVDPVLELSRLASEAGEVVTDDRVERARLVVTHHLVVGRADLGLVRRALGLVDILAHDLPASILDDLDP